MSLANGIVLSPDEKTLYVTNGAVVMAFDVAAGGSLTRQREFGKLRGGESGDGSAVDAQGRVYVGIVFFGGWGTPSARNQIVAIPMIAQSYTGRAK